MTFRLFWEKTLRNLIRFGHRVFLPVLLFLLTGLFWHFRSLGPGALNTLFPLILFLGSLYWYIKRRKESIEFLVFLSVFLGFSALYNIQFAFFIPFWLSEIFVFLFASALCLYLIFEKGFIEKRFLFSMAISVCLSEVFLVLAFWPTNPLSKSFILTSLFYAFWFIAIKKEEILRYLILVGVVVILVLATTRWPVM